MKYTISGHETFACRFFWLKKGFDFMRSGLSFSDSNAVVNLGVGKNMVNSIKYWLNAFGFFSNDDAKALECIFSDEGYDPFIEDVNTLWLLHYLLLKNGKASIYSLFFNSFNPKSEFSMGNFEFFLKLKFEEENFSFSHKSLKNDIKVFQSMYVRPKSIGKNIEDEYSGLFHDLRLFDQVSKDQFLINHNASKLISPYISLYIILDQFENNASISFSSLMNKDNSVGKVFSLNHRPLFEMLKNISDNFTFLTFKEHAGVSELQFRKNGMSKLDLLKYYYGNN